MTNSTSRFYVVLTVHLDIFIQRITNLMHNLSSVNFFSHLYIFLAYLQLIIRRYTVGMGCLYARNI